MPDLSMPSIQPSVPSSQDLGINIDPSSLIDDITHHGDSTTQSHQANQVVQNSTSGFDFNSFYEKLLIPSAQNIAQQQTSDPDSIQAQGRAALENKNNL